MTVVTTDAPAAGEREGRYEARLDPGSGVAGFAQCMRTPELIAFVHTEVVPASEGQGVGASPVQVALDEARARGLKALAICPFFAGWITRYPDYADLLYTSRSKVAD